jgi:hypothetical protein
MSIVGSGEDREIAVEDFDLADPSLWEVEKLCVARIRYIK